MGTEMMQHVVVTLVAFGALVVIARRALGFVLVRATHGSCSNCASSKGACGTAASRPAESSTHPAILIRSSVR